MSETLLNFCDIEKITAGKLIENVWVFWKLYEFYDILCIKYAKL